VQQRTEYGRLYLAVYGIQYVLHGYRNHPLERRARDSERSSRSNTSSRNLAPAGIGPAAGATLLSGATYDPTQ
jgi:hypothetical protein